MKYMLRAITDVSPFIASHSYNRYTSICGRATRSALKESERVQAERRGETSLRYQEWKDGKATDPVSFVGGLMCGVGARVWFDGSKWQMADGRWQRT